MKGRSRYTISLSLDHADTECNWEGLQDTHEIIYVAKRSAYELYLAVPRAQATSARQGRPLVLLRFKGQVQTRSWVLELDQLEDVFDGMRHVMKYLQAEEAKRRTRL